MSPMNKLREVRDEKKLDNKGFSLVELIIVIAIMAVLIGVLAPQYLKYVEKSRVSADADQIDACISAVEIYSSDPEHSVVTGKMKIDSNGNLDFSDGSDIKTAIEDAGISTANVQVKSKTFQKGCTIDFSTNGVTVSDPDIAKALGRASPPTP